MESGSSLWLNRGERDINGWSRKAMTPSKSEKVIEKTAAVVICQTDFAKVLRSANKGSGETASHLQVADVDLVASASEVRLTKHSHDVSHSRFSPRIGRRLRAYRSDGAAVLVG